MGLVCVEERRGQTVVGLEIGIGAVGLCRVLSVFVVGRHVGWEVPGGSQLKEVRMLQQEVLGPDT